MSAAALVAGCGDDRGSSAEENAARAALKDFAAALARPDYERVCALVTDDVKSDWAAFARRNRLPRACPAFAESFYETNGAGNRRFERAVRRLRDAPVRIIGDTAIVDLGTKEGDDAYLERVAGRWLVTSEDVYAGSEDADSVVERWAKAHRRRGETITVGGCTVIGDEPLVDRFICDVDVRPGDRWRDRRQFKLFMRTVNDHRDLEIEKTEQG